jgi:hypothetical protein
MVTRDERINEEEEDAGQPRGSFEAKQNKLKSCWKKRPEKQQLENQNILKGN